MNAELVRAFLLTLPHVLETEQWGGNLVFWVGHKHLGGKMFALIDLTRPTKVISYAAGPERFAELLEQPGILPAPYMARIFWVAAETWSAHREAVWHDELRAAHLLTWNKLPPKTHTTLALPPAERKRLIAARQRTLNKKATVTNSPDAPTPKKQSSTRQTASKQSTAKTPTKKIGRPTKAAKAVSLASASKAARPKKHRQS